METSSIRGNPDRVSCFSFSFITYHPRVRDVDPSAYFRELGAQPFIRTSANQLRRTMGQTIVLLSSHLRHGRKSRLATLVERSAVFAIVVEFTR